MKTSSEPSDLERETWTLFAALMTVDVDAGASFAVVHADGQRGAISAEDVLAGRLRIVDARTREVSAYKDVQGMARDGWRAEKNGELSYRSIKNGRKSCNVPS